MEKIDKLKKIFEREKIDGYIIPKNDEFFSEYIPDHNDRLNFVSNFTGSYGYALILKNKNYLFELKDKRKFDYKKLQDLNKEHYIKKINV